MRIQKIVVCLMILMAVGCVALWDYPTEAAEIDPDIALQNIQQQIIAFRDEFKLRIQAAETDRLTIYQHFQEKLQAILDKQTDLNSTRSDIATQVQQLGTLLDEYEAEISKLEEAVETIELTLHGTLDEIETQFVAIKEHGGVKPRPPVSVASPQTGPAAEEESASFDFAPGELFRAAYRVYMEGEYDVAIVGFQKYLEEYPETQLAGAAQYWIAESFVKLGEYDLAVQEYDRLISVYPENDKIPDAYYGKGVALLKLGNSTDANALFTYVIDHFPNTIAAQKARNRVVE